jgi:hypothetical protein
MKVYASDSAITVRFYSSRLGRRIETVTGEPYDHTAPETFTTKNSSLAPGTRNVVQETGASGFLVGYTRKVYRGDTLKRDESFTVRYKPQNGYVEVGPPKKPEKKKKKPNESEPKEPSAGGAPGDATTPDADQAPAEAESPVPN